MQATPVSFREMKHLSSPPQSAGDNRRVGNHKLVATLSAAEVNACRQCRRALNVVFLNLSLAKCQFISMSESVHETV